MRVVKSDDLVAARALASRLEHLWLTFNGRPGRLLVWVLSQQRRILDSECPVPLVPLRASYMLTCRLHMFLAAAQAQRCRCQKLGCCGAAPFRGAGASKGRSGSGLPRPNASSLRSPCARRCCLLRCTAPARPRAAQRSAPSPRWAKATPSYIQTECPGLDFDVDCGKVE